MTSDMGLPKYDVTLIKRFIKIHKNNVMTMMIRDRP